MAWTGLSETQMLELEADLCRVRNRRGIFGGSKDEVASGAPVTMIGRLLDYTLELANQLQKRASKELLTKQELASEIEILDSQLSKFLKGKLPTVATEKWESRGYRALKFILTGSKGDIPVSRPVANRIEKYFFRGDGSCRFFEPQRAKSANAWFDRELAGEVRFFAKSDFPAAQSIWFVSANMPFDEGDMKDVMEALEIVATAGAKVTFVFPQGNASEPDANQARKSYLAIKASLAGKDCDVNVNCTELDTPVPSFFVPQMRYLYLDGKSIADAEQALWMIRPQPDQKGTNGPVDLVEDGPLALLGYCSERSAFKQWIDESVSINIATPLPTVSQREMDSNGLESAKEITSTRKRGSRVA